MKKILFISPSTVKALTNIDDNTDEKLLVSAIKQAQDEGIRQVYGDNLYGKVEQCIANGFEDEEDMKYRTLLDESAQYLASLTVVKLLPMVSVKISNVGAYQTDDENISSLGVAQTFEMVDYYTHLSDRQKDILQRWLLTHENDYPELGACQCQAIRSNLYSAASSHLWLGGARGRRNWRK